MPLDIPAFNTAVNRARDRIRSAPGRVDVPAEQARLRAMIPADASEHDRGWTSSLIDDIAKPPAPPRTWSPTYHEAARIHAAAYPPKGTTEEQIAVLADARRAIWELAERAPAEEELDIQAMTQDLEQLEMLLRDPPFPLTDTPFPSDNG
ncbi:hypothetical protein ACXJJ3_36430 [Kribbella sp. WER1]